MSGVSAKQEAEIALDPASTPADIEARSFAIIDAEFPDKPFSGHAWEVARRLVHTSGDVSLVRELCLPDQAIAAGIAAVRAGAPIFTDTEMVRSGIPMRRLQAFGCRVSCILAAEGVDALAAEKGITRTRAGMELVGNSLRGAIVAIGNAPTALLALIEHVRIHRQDVPALVVGMPVGFVNAAESKEMLLRQRDLNALAVRGRRGGSPLAAATVNALAVIAARLEHFQNENALTDESVCVVRANEE